MGVLTAGSIVSPDLGDRFLQDPRSTYLLVTDVNPDFSFAVAYNAGVARTLLTQTFGSDDAAAIMEAEAQDRNERRLDLLDKRLVGVLTQMEVAELRALQVSETGRLGTKLRKGNDLLRQLLGS